MAKVHVVTTVSGDQRIFQHLEFSTGDNQMADLMGEKMKEVMNLREEGIKQALILLGWTPPGEVGSRHLEKSYKQQRDNLLKFIKFAEVSSGMCCCGDDMEAHGNPMDCGHSAVDMWTYAVHNAEESVKKFDAEFPQQDMAPVAAGHWLEGMLKFYKVQFMESLVVEQAAHIGRLQERLAVYEPQNPEE